MINTWKQQRFSFGNYESDHGWRINRWHDERDNFYDCDYLGITQRTFKNLEEAIRWADVQPGQMVLYD